MRYVIGVDPATVTGLAVVTAPGRGAGAPVLVAHFAGKGLSPSAWLAQLMQGLEGEVKVVIEEQYAGPNLRTLITLAHLAGRWQEAADVLGLPWEMVLASSWQAAMLRGIRAGRGRDACKRAAVQVARMRFGKTLKVDEADAALMAAFVAERWTK